LGIKNNQIEGDCRKKKRCVQNKIQTIPTADMIVKFEKKSHWDGSHSKRSICPKNIASIMRIIVMTEKARFFFPDALTCPNEGVIGHSGTVPSR
jgi:hypothetical protein